MTVKGVLSVKRSNRGPNIIAALHGYLGKHTLLLYRNDRPRRPSRSEQLAQVQLLQYLMDTVKFLVLAPLRVSVPLPCLVRPLEPLITPLMVNPPVEESLSVVAAARAIGPEITSAPAPVLVI